MHKQKGHMERIFSRAVHHGKTYLRSKRSCHLKTRNIMSGNRNSNLKKVLITIIAWKFFFLEVGEHSPIADTICGVWSVRRSHIPGHDALMWCDQFSLLINSSPDNSQNTLKCVWYPFKWGRVDPRAALVGQINLASVEAWTQTVVMAGKYTDHYTTAAPRRLIVTNLGSYI